MATHGDVSTIEVLEEVESGYDREDNKIELP
jgi:hypothetical protein